MSEAQKCEESTQLENRLGDTRQGVLEAIRAVGGEANTATVRQTTEVEIPDGSIRYHFRWLEDKGLLEEIDREDFGGGRDVIVWSLTADGEELLQTIDAKEGRGDRPQTFDGLNDRIDELEAELGQVKSRYNEMADVVEDLYERLESGE